MNTRDLNQLGGIAKPAPRLAIAFLIIVLGTVALPLSNGFIGEFLLLMGVYNYNIYYSAIAGLTIILGAVYMLRMYQRAMFGVTNELTTGFKDLDSTEITVLLILSVLIIGIGIYPQPILHISEAAITNLLEQVNQKILVK
jgi:NADH-quinone oxidoreductase subunit M